MGKDLDKFVKQFEHPDEPCLLCGVIPSKLKSMVEEQTLKARKSELEEINLNYHGN